MKKHPLSILTAAFLLTATVSKSVGGPVTFETLATFEYPGFPQTYVSKISDAGHVVGSVDTQMGSIYGYIRYPSGRLSELIIDPDGSGFTGLYGVNNVGHFCGVYEGGANPGDSFLLIDHDFITVDFPGSMYTDAFDLNDADNFCGDTYNGMGYSGFVNIGGVYTSFDIPGAFVTTAYGINNSNQCVGSYYADLEPNHGFFRDADGTLVYPVDAPGSAACAILGINDKGWMVGTSGNGLGQGNGVVFFSPTKVATYRYPGARYTAFYGINNKGLIVGAYGDGIVNHCFILRVTKGED